ncbi:hypothetical protein GQX74_013740 [Glossina fuscipes]|nr:hypothetical protein GQX74_013740 [Glossina fuscipes]
MAGRLATIEETATYKKLRFSEICMGVLKILHKRNAPIREKTTKEIIIYIKFSLHNVAYKAHLRDKNDDKWSTYCHQRNKAKYAIRNA